MLRVRLLTPKGPVYTGDAVSVQLPGTDGLFEVLTGHAPLIAALKPGPVTIKSSSGQHAYAIGEGLAEVLGDQVIVLTELVDQP